MQHYISLTGCLWLYFICYYYLSIIGNGYYTTGSWEIRMGRENGGTNIGGGVVTASSPATWDYTQLSASVGTWHNVVMTYNGRFLNFFIDGVQQSMSGVYNVPQTGSIVPSILEEWKVPHEPFVGFVKN